MNFSSSVPEVYEEKDKKKKKPISTMSKLTETYYVKRDKEEIDTHYQ